MRPDRQKLLNVKSGPKMAGDEVLLSAVKLPKTVMMMGSTESAIGEIAAAAEAAPEVVDDFDVGVDEAIDVRDRSENQEKLRNRIEKYHVEPLNPPRDGKKLLVLDIDYTLFDHRSTAERPEELARPHLHEFLASAYEHYDIAIWSATGMKWIEVKMRELGVLSNPNYRVMQLVDAGAMITVQMEKYGVFNCKPLGWLWAKYPGRYHEKNTIMFDDLRRNFVMNPGCGLKIRPFRKAHMNRGTDVELVGLAKYLRKIAHLEVRGSFPSTTDPLSTTVSYVIRTLAKNNNSPLTPHIPRLPSSRRTSPRCDTRSGRSTSPRRRIVESTPARRRRRHRRLSLSASPSAPSLLAACPISARLAISYDVKNTAPCVT